MAEKKSLLWQTLWNIKSNIWPSAIWAPESEWLKVTKKDKKIVKDIIDKWGDKQKAIQAMIEVKAEEEWKITEEAANRLKWKIKQWLNNADFSKAQNDLWWTSSDVAEKELQKEYEKSFTWSKPDDSEKWFSNDWDPNHNSAWMLRRGKKQAGKAAFRFLPDAWEGIKWAADGLTPFIWETWPVEQWESLLKMIDTAAIKSWEAVWESIFWWEWDTEWLWTFTTEEERNQIWQAFWNMVEEKFWSPKKAVETMSKHPFDTLTLFAPLVWQVWKATKMGQFTKSDWNMSKWLKKVWDNMEKFSKKVDPIEQTINWVKGLNSTKNWIMDKSKQFSKFFVENVSWLTTESQDYILQNPNLIDKINKDELKLKDIQKVIDDDNNLSLEKKRRLVNDVENQITESRNEFDTKVLEKEEEIKWKIWEWLARMENKNENDFRAGEDIVSKQAKWEKFSMAEPINRFVKLIRDKWGSATKKWIDLSKSEFSEAQRKKIQKLESIIKQRLKNPNENSEDLNLLDIKNRTLDFDWIKQFRRKLDQEWKESQMEWLWALPHNTLTEALREKVNNVWNMWKINKQFSENKTFIDNQKNKLLKDWTETKKVNWIEYRDFKENITNTLKGLSSKIEKNKQLNDLETLVPWIKKDLEEYATIFNNKDKLAKLENKNPQDMTSDKIQKNLENLNYTIPWIKSIIDDLWETEQEIEFKEKLMDWEWTRWKLWTTLLEKDKATGDFRYEEIINKIQNKVDESWRDIDVKDRLNMVKTWEEINWQKGSLLQASQNGWALWYIWPAIAWWAIFWLDGAALWWLLWVSLSNPKTASNVVQKFGQLSEKVWKWKQFPKDISDDVIKKINNWESLSKEQIDFMDTAFKETFRSTNLFNQLQNELFSNNEEESSIMLQELKSQWLLDVKN